MSVILKPHKILKTGQTENRFYLADCVDVFKQLEPHSVDVIVTSPPYNLGKEYEKKTPNEFYIEQQSAAIAEAFRSTVQGATSCPAEIPACTIHCFVSFKVAIAPVSVNGSIVYSSEWVML